MAGVVPRAFWTAKAGNAATDYEDAYAIGDDCLAIADGATESSFARLWALALAEGFISDPSAVLPCTTERLKAWAMPLQKTWVEAVPWNTLPWFAEDKARSGAFATLVGFQFHPDAQTWRAFAIGDSCFFLIRDGVLKQAFPLEHSSQFDSRPILLSSNPANNKRVWDDVVMAEGEYHAGDLLIFATDALAKWLLARAEAGERPWDTLCGLSSQEEFETFVTELRQDRVMRNDDVTLVIVGETRGNAEPEPPSALAPTSESAPPVLYAGTSLGAASIPRRSRRAEWYHAAGDGPRPPTEPIRRSALPEETASLCHGIRSGGGRMNWPLASDYQDAIQNPAQCFQDPQLRAGKPVLTKIGLPRVASGTFASVYEIHNGAQRWAVRCFLRPSEDQQSGTPCSVSTSAVCTWRAS